MTGKPFAALLAVLVAFGCGDPPTTSTALNDEAVAPSFNFMNGPEFAGIVMRFELPLSWTWSDPKAGMRATVGLDMAEFCADIEDFDVFAVQDVNLPNGRLLGPIHGNHLRTAVWPFTAFDCDLFTTIAPLATGFSDFRLTDNDVFQTGNTNAWGWRVHGRLTLGSGADASFSGHVNIMINANNVVVRRKISLH